MAETPQITNPEGARALTHTLHALFRETWQKALDVYEGIGGFLSEDKPYLIAHPREFLDHSVPDRQTGAMVPNPNPQSASPKLKMRRKLARYENVCEAILDTVIATLFADTPSRTFADGKKELPIGLWWQDVDGTGLSIDAAMQQSWVGAAVFGHTVILMDKAKQEPVTAADQSFPRLRFYSPLDVLDWLVDESGKVIAVKLLEAAPRTTFAPANENDIRIRVVNETEWVIYNEKGEKIESAEHGFGRLPVVILYGKRRAMLPVVGKAIVGDPQLYIDLYNLISEVRELLRNQTFAILNVTIGKDGDVLKEQQSMGQQSGTANVLFTTESAQFISPSGENVDAYHEHIDRVQRMIYRLASVPWESDSKDAEAEGSRKLKRADMVMALRRYAGELQGADDAITELFYRATKGESWEQALETDGVDVRYPDNFNPPELKVVADTASAAMALELGDTATKELKKATARTFLPNASPETLKQVDAEIDAQEILTEDEKQEKLLEKAGARMALAGAN